MDSSGDRGKTILDLWNYAQELGNLPSSTEKGNSRMLLPAFDAAFDAAFDSTLDSNFDLETISRPAPVVPTVSPTCLLALTLIRLGGKGDF